MSKEKIYQMHADICSIFSSPKRLEIIDVLRDKELSVLKIAEKLNIKQSNLSQHLTIMREKGILKMRKEKTNKFYSISSPKIIKAFDIIKEFLIEKLKDNEKLYETLSK